MKRVVSARLRLRRHCLRNDLKFFYTFTLKRSIDSLVEFDSVLERLTACLTRAGIHPWALVREQTEGSMWHAHLAVSTFVDLRLLVGLWSAAVGEGAGYVEQPDKDRAGTFMAEKVGHYLSKAFEHLPDIPGRQRQRYFFASKRRAGEGIDRTPRIRYVRAESLGQVLQDEARKVRISKLSYFRRYKKRPIATLEARSKGQVHANRNRDARVGLVRAIWRDERRLHPYVFPKRRTD